MEFFLKLKNDGVKGFKYFTPWGYIVIFLTLSLMFVMAKNIRDDEKYKEHIENLTTGGDSYLLMYFNNNYCTNNRLSYDIQNKGKYPLKGIFIELIDYDAASIGFEKIDNYLTKRVYLIDTTINSIASHNGIGGDLNISIINELHERNFILTISTDYLKFEQFIKFRQKNGKAFFASRTINFETKKIIFDTIYNGFLNEGENKNTIKWINTEDYGKKLLEFKKKYKLP